MINLTSCLLNEYLHKMCKHSAQKNFTTHAFVLTNKKYLSE
jgi:hypothetical protein